MKIASVFKVNPTLQIGSSLMPKRTTMPQISFKGDSFEHTIDEDFKKLEAAKRIADVQKTKLTELQLEMATAKYSSVEDELYKRTEFQRKLDSIHSEYAYVNNMLNSTKGSTKAINYQIIADYFEAKSRMAKDKGFNRIKGYDAVKDKLNESFCFDIILKDRLVQDDPNKAKKVPNVVFFYGPTGTGKSTFAKALGEESLSALVKPDFNGLGNNDAKIERIEDLAKKALKTYKDTNGQKRTIILIDEADSLIRAPKLYPEKDNKQKEIVDKFINLAKNCSEKYKCTLFITTNEPLRVDERILNKEITPIKVGLGPCDKDTAKQIFDYLFGIHKLNIDTTEIVNELFKNPAKRYSNSNLVAIVEAVMQTTSSPTKGDFLELIREGDDVPPSIQPRDMKRFKEAKEKLIPLTDPQWRDLI